MSLVAASLAACGSDDARIVPAEKSLATVTLTPEAGHEKAPLSTEVGITVEGGEITEIVMRDEGGGDVAGRLRDDASSWVPDKPLKPAMTYTVNVTAVDERRIPNKVETSFTTMAAPKKTVEPRIWNEAGYAYGQAMPVMLDFPEDYEVPEKYRDDVERRLFVTTEPAQAGSWHWFNGRHLEYRAEEFWVPGTTIDVHAALKGVPLGRGEYGAKDMKRTISIDKTERVIEVSNKDKEMVAKKNGEVVKKMPISLGKSSTPSYSGTMTIMEQLQSTVFDTTAQCGGRVMGDNCYRTPVDWAMRLTWSGQFIHSAPWSVGDQGHRNVSHGCVNASAESAKWVFNFSRVGDPVVITGTEEDLPYGDGYASYDLDWDEFRQGSYLPDTAKQADADTDTDTPDTED
ncbi:Lipoprotein-anchoring transpeptidase ErfK/SrfK [Stackebrandtia soli]